MYKLYKAVVLALLLFSSALFAQSYTISGKVTSVQTGEELIGANVILKGTTLGAATDANGKYTIKANEGTYTIVCSYVGFKKEEFEINLTKNMVVDFNLNETQFSLSLEVVADRAKERQTPVAYTDIEKADMEMMLGSRDIPLVLNTTPSVYSTQQGGGAGDARINVRGFNQRNVAIMINGVPVNDMENGWVYWSNWDGVADATSSIQLQRGLSAINLATPSIGGTMNVITDPTKTKPGISFKQEFATGTFSKSTFSFNTGLLNDKIAFNGTVVRKTGEGIYDGTWTDAWAYYFGAAYNINANNRLEFYAIGAPQRHGQNLYRQNIAVYSKDFAKGVDGYDQAAFGQFHEAGRYFNQNWAPVSQTYTGPQWTGSEIAPRHSPYLLNERENFYHKPQINLNYYSNLTKMFSLYATVYYSGGVGGGTGLLGSYRRNSWEGPFDNTASKFYYMGSPWTINWDETIAINQADSGQYFIDKTGHVKDDQQSVGIIRSSRNNQDTYGAIAKGVIKINRSWTAQIGADWRTAKIDHYREVTDLLGGQYWVDKGNDAWGAAGRKVGLGDKIDYNFTNTVNWVGFYGQAEYATEKFTGYATVGWSTISYKHNNHFMHTSSGSEIEIETDSYTGYQFKGGLNFNLTKNLSLYANGGYISKVPILDAVINDQTSTVIPDQKNETFISGELGMNYMSSNRKFYADVNVYYTQWNDRTYTVTDFDQLNGDEGLFVISGIDALHMGFEASAGYQPVNFLKFDAALSIGDWKNTNNASALYKDYKNSADDSTLTVYSKDLKVGDAPQTQLALTGTWMPTRNLNISLVYKYFADFYADWTPVNRINPNDNAQSWKTPAYSLFDLHVSYMVPVDLGKAKLRLFAHVFNLFDTLYIQDALDNSPYNGYTANGTNHSADDAEVFLGLPRYINAGFSVNF